MMFRLGSRSWRNMQGLHPNIGFMVTEAIKITPVDFTVFEGVRTMEKQREYVESGASKTMDSYHLYGLAVDLVPFISGSVRFEEMPMRKVVEACKSVIVAHGLGIENGWDLWGWDMWHFQMTGSKGDYDVRRYD